MIRLVLSLCTCSNFLTRFNPVFFLQVLSLEFLFLLHEVYTWDSIIKELYTILATAQEKLKEKKRLRFRHVILFGHLLDPNNSLLDYICISKTQKQTPTPVVISITNSTTCLWYMVWPDKKVKSRNYGPKQVSEFMYIHRLCTSCSLRHWRHLPNAIDQTFV